MKTILIPTDFSDNAFIAAQYGAELASKANLKVLVYHAYIVLYSGFEEKGASVQQIEWADEEAGKAMAKLIESLKSHFPNLEIEGKCERGFLVDTLKEEIKENSQIVGIVMGSKGATNLAETVFGSTTYAILKDSQIPVLVVPSDTKEFQLNKLGYFTDLNDHDSLAFDKMKNLLSNNGQEVFIHLSKKTEEELGSSVSSWKNKFGSLSPDNSIDLQIVNSDKSWLSINGVAEALNLDLLVFSKPHKPFFANLFHKSLTKEISNHPIIPTLIIPMKD